jgi:hypothetical protein
MQDHSIRKWDKQTLLGLCQRLGSPAILFWTLPALMLLLLVGTISQKYLGLYVSIHQFFDSWIIWLWHIVPLPGFYPIMIVFSINLFFRFIFRSPWSWQKAGLHMAHFGVLVLVIGGLFTSLSAKEGFLALKEGSSNQYVSDYHKRVLVLFEGDTTVQNIDFNVLTKRSEQKIGPFVLTINESCRNCEIQARTVGVQSSQKMANVMTLRDKPVEKEDERNMSGIGFTLNGEEYIAFEGMPEPITLESENRKYQLLFGKDQRALPFVLKLERFTQDNYPGSDTARNYSSDITIIDGKSQVKSQISMNNPLRYKGYSFYQSSYERTPEETYSILTVVENKGRLFPYIACLIIGLGLLYHAVMRYLVLSEVRP